jgi:hypothetical protein
VENQRDAEVENQEDVYEGYVIINVIILLLYMESYNNNKGFSYFKLFKPISPTFYLTSTDPAYQYQAQKIIQKTTGVYSSLYDDNISALNIYQYPTRFDKQNWNQMSDRPNIHYQPNSANSHGSFYHPSSLRHTQTRLRPGALTPGGYGVDIKHNSYYRYLGRLKGKKNLRRGTVPYEYGNPIKGGGIYGAKTIKTNIVTGCNICEENPSPEYLQNEKRIYKINDVENKIKSTLPESYPVGTRVFGLHPGTKVYSPAIIKSIINNDLVLIYFTDTPFTQTCDYSELYSYYIVSYTNIFPYRKASFCNNPCNKKVIRSNNININ